jgi:hypothetical protein
VRDCDVTRLDVHMRVVDFDLAGVFSTDPSIYPNACASSLA